MVRWDTAQVCSWPACSWPGHSRWTTRTRSTMSVAEHAAALTQRISDGAQGGLLHWLEDPCSLRTKGSQMPPPFLSPPQTLILPLLAIGRDGGWGLATHKVSIKEIRLCSITHALSLSYDCLLSESKPPSEELEKAGSGLSGCV